MLKILSEQFTKVTDTLGQSGEDKMFALFEEVNHLRSELIGQETSVSVNYPDLHRLFSTKKDHILNQEFTTLPSGRRLRCLICKTNRFKNSFMPVAVRLLNNT